MVAVRVLAPVAGSDFSWQPGDVVDMPGDQAEKWADGVRAELVRGREPETPERAVPAPETTASTSRRSTGKAARRRPPKDG